MHRFITSYYFNMSIIFRDTTLHYLYWLISFLFFFFNLVSQDVYKFYWSFKDTTFHSVNILFYTCIVSLICFYYVLFHLRLFILFFSFCFLEGAFFFIFSLFSLLIYRLQQKNFLYFTWISQLKSHNLTIQTILNIISSKNLPVPIVNFFLVSHVILNIWVFYS